TSAAAEVLALGVLAEDDEIDGAGIAERREIGMEQLHRPKVDVQIELEPESQQNVAGVLVPRHSGVAKGAEEDRIDAVPEPGNGRGGQRFPRLELMSRGFRHASQLIPEP